MEGRMAKKNNIKLTMFRLRVYRSFRHATNVYKMLVGRYKPYIGICTGNLVNEYQINGNILIYHRIKIYHVPIF